MRKVFQSLSPHCKSHYESSDLRVKASELELSLKSLFNFNIALEPCEYLVVLSSIKERRHIGFLRHYLSELGLQDLSFSYYYKQQGACTQLCGEFLWREIELRSPKAILLLGCCELLGFDFNLSCGQDLPHRGFRFLSSYEPGFLLANPSYENSFKEHLKQLYYAAKGL